MARNASGKCDVAVACRLLPVADWDLGPGGRKRRATVELRVFRRKYRKKKGGGERGEKQNALASSKCKQLRGERRRSFPSPVCTAAVHRQRQDAMGSFTVQMETLLAGSDVAPSQWVEYYKEMQPQVLVRAARAQPEGPSWRAGCTHPPSRATRARRPWADSRPHH